MTRQIRVLYFVLASALVIMFGTTQHVEAQEAKCEAGFRLIAHVKGKTCVSEKPQRVIALEWTYVENVLALGVQPIGIADVEGYHDWVKLPLALDDAAVQDVGDRSEPNLELITKLQPDLILAVDFRVAENYDELSKIAPTLVFNPYPVDGSSHFEEMKTTFSTIATALGREDEGKAVLAHMDQHFVDARAALKAAGRADETFILSQGWTYDKVATFRLFTDNAMAVQILEQIGLKNAWKDVPQQYGFTEIGIEGFAQLADSEFNFFYVAQNSDNDFFAESPLWSNLAFVKAQRAYWMGGDVWLFGGPLSAEVLTDTVLTAMQVELPTVTPDATN